MNQQTSYKITAIINFLTALIGLYGFFKIHWAWIFMFFGFIFSGVIYLFKSRIKNNIQK